jgi:hypothetical protein
MPPRHTRGVEVLLHTFFTLALVAARTKAWVYVLSPAVIIGSNPTEGVDIFMLRVLFIVR